ncbi:hypothetical protein WJX79_000002 [Trebouxia sp. C0005]
MHNALLTPQHKAKLSGESEHSVAIESGHTQLYHNWWQQDPSNICLFGAHLIGDAEEPSQYASIALTDLAFCSTWGRNRVQEHTDTERALRLILPVKTDPAIVLQAVAGLNSGSIGLHMGNVEPILVLANAIGMECLEAACIVFLCDHIMRSEMPKRGKTYDLADTDVKLLVCAKEGKFGVYLGCDGGLVKHWPAFILFEVCTHAPYVRRCHMVAHHKLKTRYSGHGHYVSEIMDGHPATFQGPFTIGVCWKMPTDSKSAGTVDCSSQAS